MIRSDSRSRALFDRTIRILRAKGLAMVLPTAGASVCLLLSFWLITWNVGATWLMWTLFLVPLVPGVWSLGRAVSVADLPLAEPRTPGSVMGAGTLGLVPFLPVLASVTTTSELIASYPWIDGVTPQALALHAAAATLGTAMLAPWMSAASVYAAGGVSPFEALARSVRVALRVGIAHTAAVGAISGLLVSLPTMLVLVIGGPRGALASLVSIPLGAAAWMITLALLAAFASSPLRAQPSSMLAIVSAPLLMLAATAAIVVSASPPMWQAIDVDCPPDLASGEAEARSHAVQFTEAGFFGVWVHPQGTDRATLLRAPRDEMDRVMSYGGSRACPDVATGRIAVTSARAYRRSARGAWVDSTGARLYDSPLDRLRARDSELFDAAALVALILASWSLARSRSRDAFSGGPGTMRVLRLRVPKGASLAGAEGVLTPTGDVRLETTDGALVVRLVRPVPTISLRTYWQEGDELSILSPQLLTGLGPREGAVELAQGALIADATEDVDGVRTLETTRAVAPVMLACMLFVLFAIDLVLLRL